MFYEFWFFTGMYDTSETKIWEAQELLQYITKKKKLDR